MVTFVTKEKIEQLVGTKIKNLDLYQKAFVHKSAIKEYEQFNESFETLEFIGDSVLGFVITKFLFDRYESRQEGFLTKARTKLVRGETLAKIANSMGLNDLVIMDEKGMRNSWNNNPKILEDVFEALIGAIYMDLGLLHAKEFVLRTYNNPNLVDMNTIMVDDNYKDHLMRHCQVNNKQLPEYRVAGHHEGLFYIDVYIDNNYVSRGIAKSKKQAEQEAAKHFFQGLEYLKQQGFIQ
jgi:ribonuclease-3